MKAKFSQSFKIQAVEKALNRANGTTLQEIADTLCVGYSTLGKWIARASNQAYESDVENESSMTSNLKKAKRPQDWSMEERLNLVIASGTLDEAALSELCRTQGLYVHHVNQWKRDFMGDNRLNNKGKTQSELTELRHENKALRKELNRKDKALAETAALLVLQKKVNAIWGNGEDNSQ